jgi:hypothetical protein
MSFLLETGTEWSSVMLPVAAGLLIEELTYGGLVRLLLAPTLESARRRRRNNKQAVTAPAPRRQGEKS